MSEVNNKNMYLNLEGLQTYNRLIQKFITDNDSELSTAIGALNAKLGEFEFDSSDDMTVAATLEYIKGAIAELVAKDYELFAKDAELEKKIAEEIGKIVGELGDSDSHMTLVDIADQLKSLGSSVSNIEGRVATLEGTIDDLKNLGGENGLVAVVDKVNANTTAIDKLNGEGEGSVKKALDDAKAHADGLVKDAEGKSLFDAAGAAATAEQNAKDYADELNGAMNERVAALEEIDHNHENKGVLDGISAEKVAAWDAAEQNAKNYADGLASNYDAAGTATTAAAQALADAQTYVDGKVDGKFDAVGSAAAAQAAAEQKATDLNAAMNSRVDAIEGKVKSWDTAAGRINTFLDSKEVDTTVDTLHEIQEWMNGEGVDATDLTTAIAAEAKLREDADKAINDKIGAVTEGKTVVGMIEDAQTAAVASAKSYTDEREVVINAALAEKATVVALNALGGRVDEDIENLTNLLGDYSGTLGDVDDRLVLLESFVKAHESISESDIIDLFKPNTKA